MVQLPHTDPSPLLKIPLQSGWQVHDYPPDTARPADLSSTALDTTDWLPAPVPGDVNAVLVAAGIMPTPHFGDNARQCYWVSAREWWYRMEFAHTPGAPQCDLCLDGVDGHVNLYLNGEHLGRMENAFRLYRCDVSGKLRGDVPNVLLLRFQAIDAVLGGPRTDELGGWGDRRTLMRKPQYPFGWDWALPLPSIGIAGGVWLEEHAGPRLLDVAVQPFITGRLDWQFAVNTAARDAGYHLVLRVHGHGAAIEQRIERPGRVKSYVTVQVENPQLWWPNGMGAQPLYDYEVELVVGGVVVERRTGRLGIRETRILEEPFTEEAGPGIAFWLEINRQRVFCKGGNWIPPELWPATATEEQYRFYLQKTAEANFNMQRIWGGGIYERELFYDLCDELGIMVWQDFMFASAGYPLARLRQEIIAEAEYQVKRLRNRASVVLWCGCNEDIYSWWLNDEPGVNAMMDTGVYSADSGAVDRLRDDPQLYSMILRGTVSRLGLGVPFIESSPMSHEDFGNAPESGNCHISAWKYALFQTDGDYQRWREHFDAVCSFDSEFCDQGPCCERTLRQFLPAEHHWPPDEMWIYHIQRGHANLPHFEQTMRIAGGIFGEIDSLATYVKHGQATHAEMMRAEFESARRDRPNNGGTMMWAYNDCWPTSNWSIIDYYRRPKPAYYAAKRACATWLPIIFARQGQIDWFIANDGRESGQVTMTYGQERLSGVREWASTVDVTVAPVATVRFDRMPREELHLQPGDYLFIEALLDGHPLPRITYFPRQWKEVAWPEPHCRLELRDQEAVGDGWRTSLGLSTDAYARFLHLSLPEERGRHWWEDNWFDLCAGACREVNVWSSWPLTADEITLGHWRTPWGNG